MITVFNISLTLSPLTLFCLSFLPLALSLSFALSILLQVSLLLCAAFLLAWSPYAVISMRSALGYHVPPLNGLMASLFAKSASFYNPFIYMGLSAKFRSDLAELFRCLHQPLERLRLRSPTPSEGEAQGGGGYRQPGLVPDEVQVNLDRFKEPLPGDEALLEGGLDSRVEMGRSWSNRSVPPQREAGVGGENEERKLGGGEEEEEMASPQTDCPRSPLMGSSGAPTLHSFIRRPSDTGRL